MLWNRLTPKYDALVTRNLKGAIVLVAFSRPNLLPKVLESIQKANTQKLPLVVVFQSGNSSVKKILDEKLTDTDYLFQVSGESRTTVNNISFNRFFGYDFAFTYLECNYVLAFEDDVLVSPDIFDFAKYIFEKFAGVRRFRGINFGSHEVFTLDLSTAYSFQRFGIHGPASGITEETWRHFNRFRFMQKAKSELFDSIFEPYLKSGFMVTPTNSRFLDIGVGGTHTSQNAEDPYFSRMHRSFVTTSPILKKYYSHRTNHSWREDVFPYQPKDNLLFDLLRFFGERRSHIFFRKIERALYKLFIIPRLNRN